MSDESIKPPFTSDNSLAPSLSYIGSKTRVKFVGSCLKSDSHVPENFCEIKIFPSLLWKKNFIYLFGV